MGSRKNHPERCVDCRLRPQLCICSLIPRLEIDTKVIVLIHYREVKRSSNSGKLAHLMLPNSDMRVRGIRGQLTDTSGLVLKERQSLLLFPSEDAVVLTPEFLATIKRPITLIVPDGSWRQASKVPNREVALNGIPRVKVPFSSPSEYRLRVETRPEGLSTFEAIARSLGIIEGRGVQEEMEKVFRVMVERTLWARAKISKAECLSGIPVGAIG